MDIPGIIAATKFPLVLAAGLSCPPAPAAPVAEVLFAPAMTKYTEDYPASRIRLLMADDPDSTLVTDTRSIVLGVTAGKISYRTEIAFKSLTNPSTHQQCLYVESAKLTVSYEPSVYVASEVKNLPCTRETTRAHEQKHVSIDYTVINSYLPHIKRDLQAHLNASGRNAFGPYPEAQQRAWREKIGKNLADAALPFIERLKEARRRQQGVIDTAENYARESAQCPQEHRALSRAVGGVK